jgi:hypothetical protein
MIQVKLLKDWSSTPQNFVSKAKDFLIDEAGWSLVTTVSGTEFDKDYVLTSSGTDINTLPFYVRLRGYGNHIYLHGYEDFTNTTTYSGQIHNNTYSRVFTGISGTDFQYWLFGDQNHMKFVIRDVTTDYNYHGYAGLIESYYSSGVDKYPILIHGTQGNNEYWEDNMSSWMMTSTLSGAVYSVYSYPFTYIQSHRGSHYGGFKLVFFQPDTSSKEVRGEPYGIYRVPTSLGGKGIEYILPSGIYYGFNKSGSQDYGYLYGPVEGPNRC